jgi:hypothetical protein
MYSLNFVFSFRNYVEIFLNKYIILKLSLSNGTSYFIKLSKTILNSILPGALIPATIVPLHLTITMSKIIKIFSYIDIVICPPELTFAALLVIHVFTLVFITTRRP